MSKADNISSIFYASDAAYLIGFPKKELVQTITQSPQQFYQQKTKPTINIFRLFPKIGMKTTSKLSGAVLQNLQLIASQFQYEQDNQASFGQGKRKSMGKTSSSNESSDGSLLKKNPLFRLYSPSNPVLKQQYSIYSHQSYKKIVNKQEEEILKQKTKEWIDIGYHIHVVQAFKIQNLQGKNLIFLQKLKGRTLRDWISQGFFSDKNKYLNSKRVLNCLLQIAVGLNYIHRRGHTHQQLIPDYIFVENDKVLKIGHLAGINPLMGKLSKNFSIGGSPQYWSPQQGNIFDNVRQRAKDGNYSSSMKLLPSLTQKSDLYQLGVLILQFLFSQRKWARGDKIIFQKIIQQKQNSHCNPATVNFLLQKAEDFLRTKGDQRLSLHQFIVDLLDFYAKNFKNAEDMLWCRFFDEEKYQSDLLNNKAVGLYLSGNQNDCQKAWLKSLNSNPQNLIAQFNYSHFKRMKRAIDDKKLNKQLYLLPQSRKRNFYLLISNLVMLPLLKQPFKTFNFNPKLSKHKQIEVLSNILDTLQKFKKPKEYSYLKKYHLRDFFFDQAYIINNYFLARGKKTNTFYAFRIDQDIRAHTFTEIKCSKQPSNADGRQAYSAVDLTNTYLAISDHSYLSIMKIDNLQHPVNYMQIGDYGSSITTLEFDQKSQVLGIGSNQFTVKLINLTNKTIYKVINIGQKFIIKNLQYYDRNTCICYSYQKAVSCNRIQTTKQLFTIRANAHIINYKILQVSLTSHLMIAHTLQKFQIWNLKQKTLIRNIQIDQAPKIQGFFAISSKKLVIHHTKHTIRIWNYSNGLILKTFRMPIPLVWVHVDSQAKNIRSLDAQGNFMTRFIDFTDFIKHFDGVCIPNQICMTDQREQHNDQIVMYVKYGRQLIQNLNQYRLNQQQKKVSLQKMYKVSQTIKTSLFYQDKEDLKVIFTYLNSIKQTQDKSSRINAHSQQYIFTSHREEFITAVSNIVDGYWLIGQSDGSIRLVSAPNNVHLTIKPKNLAVQYLYLQSTSFFIGYQGSCFLIQRQNLNIVVTHSAYHKKPVRLGVVLSSVLVTGDQDELILFWNKQKVRRYKIPVNMGDVVGKKLIIAGFDNRVRIYDMHPQNGIQKQHVFVGHVMNIYNMVVIDDGIFTTYSYDGTIRWWNTQVKNCFSYYNFKKYFRTDKILYVDMPKFSLQEEKYAKFDREGCALILLNGNQIVIFDTMRKQTKWKIQMAQEIVKVFWTNYPNQFAAVSHQQITILNVYWRYMTIKK